MSIFRYNSLYSPSKRQRVSQKGREQDKQKVIMTDIPGDKVAFIAVPGAYKTGENVLVKYGVDINFETTSRDWVGLFCVGWTSNRDYYTFEWIEGGVRKPSEEEEEKTVCQVKFSGSRLPPEDGHFYQFCYVTSNGVVKGASRPFQFVKTVGSDCIGDLDDLVEVNEEDSLVFLRTRHETQLTDLQKKVKHLTTANETVEATFVTVKSDMNELQEKCDNVTGQFEASQAENADLKALVEAKEEQIQKMKETLEKRDQEYETSQREVGLLQKTVVSKEEEIQVSKTVIERLSKEVEDITIHSQDMQVEKVEREKQMQELGYQVTLLVDENKTLQDNEKMLRDKCNQLDQETREAMEIKEVLESRMEYKENEAKEALDQVDLLKAQIVSLEEEMDEMAGEIEKEQAEKKKLIETVRIKQEEVNFAQENLCEVIGQVKEPRDLLDRQTSSENIDKSALEALQLAYTDVERRWNNERRSVARLRNKLAEMECRIKECGKEFEAQAKENVDLKKQLKRSRSSSLDSEKPTEESQATILLLQREYERLELELQEFQLKHDQRIDEKNQRVAELERELEKATKEVQGRQNQEDAMKKAMDTLKHQNNELAAANTELTRKLEKERSKNRYPHHQREVLVTPNAPFNPAYTTPRPPVGQGYPPIYPAVPASESRECPVCHTRFPVRMSQKEFERHVQGHFQN